VPADCLSDALCERLGEFIARKTGLHFPPERRADLQRGIASAAKEFGFIDSSQYADWLLATPLTEGQMCALASHLTVGETYFFRERKTFDALAERILPEFLYRRRGREQHLRLWSAACCTGEEPYSLAILVQRLLGNSRDWHVTIRATDISERFLQKAAAGTYGEWSFRESPPGLKERYFTRSADGRYTIDPDIKGRVRFSQMNLAGDTFPSVKADIHAMDVILCRNALMYFTPDQARKVIEKLHHTLIEGGWLIVAPSECSQALFSRFSIIKVGDALVYRKEPPSAPSSETCYKLGVAEADIVPKLNTSDIPSPPVSEAILTQSQEATSASDVTSPTPLHEIAAAARALADQGQLVDALAWTERWIAADKTDAAAHYLQAMILQEVGERTRARRALSRVVYLEPDFALAHFALGNLARAEASHVEANKHFENALHVLRRASSDELLPQSDGMTAGRLAEIITAFLAAPDQPVSPNGHL
jgi:chemotaxis protein methyltransferase CheR